MLSGINASSPPPAASALTVGVLSYAPAEPVDVGVLAVRIWWTGVVWCASYMLWQTWQLIQTLLEGGAADLTGALYFCSGVGSLAGAGLMLGMLIRGGPKTGTMRRSVHVAALVTLVLLATYLVPYGMQVREQQQARGTTYAVTLSCEGLSINLAWWMGPLAVLVIGRALAPKPLRAETDRPSPWRLALFAGGAASAALLCRHLAQLGYLVPNGLAEMWRQLQRADWAQIAIVAGIQSVAVMVIAGVLIAPRGPTPRVVWLVTAALLLTIATQLLTTLRQFPPLSLRELPWHTSTFAAMISALTWPRHSRATGVAAG
jgi:uncharacterized membrane protein YozB (DUF420 family)